MRKESTFNQGLDENLICRSLEFFASQKIGMTGLKGITFLFCLLSGVAHAECVPTPDCASIGYTATSCDGGFLRCPFDTSKLFCIPCDSSYKYTCSGDNITGGVGSACGGKYASCKCSEGSVFSNGTCVCDTSCKVGAIYYSDASCSACVDSSKTAIGVVVKDNELVLSQRSSNYMYWSSVRVDTSLTNYQNATDAKEDFNGKSNTATIMTDDTSNIAAKYCNDYTTAGTSAGDWYLPAAGELYSYVYSNYSAINTAMAKLSWTWDTTWLWSSSEYDDTTVWLMLPATGKVSEGSKSDTPSGYYVSCLLAL